MFKRFIAALVILVCILAAASFFSPHRTVYDMRDAIEKRDYNAFSQYVDYPALRESFRAQIGTALQEIASDNSGDTGLLEALTKGIVGSMVTPILDVMITPAGVIEMMNRGTPKITQAVVIGAITQTPATPESIPDMKLSYRGWNKVALYRADSPDSVDRFILVRDGLWSWKLAAVEL